MAKMTLLDMVQSVLSVMDDDEVNSIGDTVESLQVAETIRDTYNDIIGGLEESFFKGVFQLESRSDTTKPTHLDIGTSIKKIDELYYNTKDSGKVTWTKLSYVEPAEFIRDSVDRSTDSDVVEVVDDSGITLYIKNSEEPTKYTTFNEDTIILNSWDNTAETTAQGKNTLVIGYSVPSFSLSDNFVPKLPEDYFPLLLAEAKNSASVNFKQVSNSVEAGRGRHQRVRLMNNRHKVSAANTKDYSNYGRRQRR